MGVNHPEASILHKCKEMILLLNIHLNHFPKHEKYGLSQQIRQCAYDVYGLLVECQKQGKTDSLTSIMANALQTASFAHLCKRIKNERPELIPALPLHRSI